MIWNFVGICSLAIADLILAVIWFSIQELSIISIMYIVHGFNNATYVLFQINLYINKKSLSIQLTYTFFITKLDLFCDFISTFGRILKGLCHKIRLVLNWSHWIDLDK